MSHPAIRLDDLDRLAGLLPDCTPPRAVAEIARAALEIRPEGGRLMLEVEVPAPETAVAEIARLAGPVAPTLGDSPVEEGPADDAGPVEEEPAVLPAAEEDGAAATQPVPAVRPAAAAANNFQPRPWSAAEDATLMRMWGEGASVKSMAVALPGRTIKSIQLRKARLQRQDDMSAPAVAPAKALSTAAEPPAPPAKPAKAAPMAPAGIDEILEALAELDDSFAPIDDKTLVEQRYLGTAFGGIAEALGCDEATAKARWRAILKCRVQNSGGILTEKGWADLRAAVARRAAEAEA